MKTSTLLLLSLLLFTTIISCKTTKKKQRKYLTSFYQELKDSFPSAEVILLQDSIRVIFPDYVMFESGVAILKDTCFDKMLKLANLVNKYNSTNLLITGHTDNVGAEFDNDKLSKDRAENVKTKLIENKVTEQRLFVWGRGARMPRGNNDTEQGKAKNRRVEFVVLYHEE